MSDRLGYDQALEHLRSALDAVVKCHEAVREQGLGENGGEGIIEFEFSAWALNDKLRGVK